MTLNFDPILIKKNINIGYYLTMVAAWRTSLSRDRLGLRFSHTVPRKFIKLQFDKNIFY